MASINFIGGEKGGVGKSVTARALAQYFIDKGTPFTGFDTDRSHNSFNRFYADYASPVEIDSYEGMDMIAAAFEDNPQQSVIVDLAAQTSAPLAKWIADASLMELFAEMGVTVYLQLSGKLQPQRKATDRYLICEFVVEKVYQI